ncbi:MAG TPA: hypothetical protein ENI64_08290 [Gammaproteobacteria bacterium]|nr:hypothetical protein [Gammaproteobacteria bacterium]
MKVNFKHVYVILGIVFLAGLTYGVVLLFELSGNPAALLLDITTWFDPVYFQYNLLLALFAILIVPVIILFYVVKMRDEKIRSVERELSKEEINRLGHYIHERIYESFRFKNYIGSTITLTIVIIFGVSIFLLLKPMPFPTVPPGSQITGVDFSKGANFLMLGPYMFHYVANDDHAFMARLMISLTAFMYGFAGAYTYLIGHMVRSYFTLDMVPNIFVSSSIRMITGSILALVLSFAYGDISDYMVIHGEGEEPNTSLIPIISFFIGFFPSRGLAAITKIASAALGLKGEKYSAIPLSKLSGMSQAHEIRLNREGFDNLDNMASICWLDLALKTGFSYTQLQSWAGQAWLYNHMGTQDYEQFRKFTGITDANDLKQYLVSVADEPDWTSIFNTPGTVHISQKARIVSQLVENWLKERKSIV